MNAAEFYSFDVDELAPLVERIGPTPEEFGQVDVDMSKWDALRDAGRHWLTGKETIPGARGGLTPMASTPDETGEP